jgi:hypothetical protein
MQLPLWAWIGLTTFWYGSIPALQISILYDSDSKFFRQRPEAFASVRSELSHDQVETVTIELLASPFEISFHERAVAARRPTTGRNRRGTVDLVPETSLRMSCGDRREPLLPADQRFLGGAPSSGVPENGLT